MCIPAALTLAPTKTHAARRAAWVPLAGDLYDGTLTVCQGRREATTYRVQLCRAEGGGMVALLAKEAAGGDVYECVRVEAGWACTCTGHRRHGRCKHADALGAAEGEGLLG